MKRLILESDDVRILELAYRYCRTLKAVEQAHAIGDSEALEIMLGGVDPVDLRIVANDLEQIWRRARLAPEIVGTEPRVTTASPDDLSGGGSHSGRIDLRSSVPPSFFPESRDAWRG